VIVPRRADDSGAAPGPILPPSRRRPARPTSWRTTRSAHPRWDGSRWVADHRGWRRKAISGRVCQPDQARVGRQEEELPAERLTGRRRALHRAQVELLRGGDALVGSTPRTSDRTRWSTYACRSEGGQGGEEDLDIGRGDGVVRGVVGQGGPVLEVGARDRPGPYCEGVVQTLRAMCAARDRSCHRRRRSPCAPPRPGERSHGGVGGVSASPSGPAEERIRVVPLVRARRRRCMSPARGQTRWASTRPASAGVAVPGGADRTATSWCRTFNQPGSPVRPPLASVAARRGPLARYPWALHRPCSSPGSSRGASEVHVCPLCTRLPAGRTGRDLSVETATFAWQKPEYGRGTEEGSGSRRGRSGDR